MRHGLRLALCYRTWIRHAVRDVGHMPSGGGGGGYSEDSFDPCGAGITLLRVIEMSSRLLAGSCLRQTGQSTFVDAIPSLPMCIHLLGFVTGLVPRPIENRFGQDGVPGSHLCLFRSRDAPTTWSWCVCKYMNSLRCWCWSWAMAPSSQANHRMHGSEGMGSCHLHNGFRCNIDNGAASNTASSQIEYRTLRNISCPTSHAIWSAVMTWFC